MLKTSLHTRRFKRSTTITGCTYIYTVAVDFRNAKMKLMCSVLAVTMCLTLLLGGTSGQSLLVSDMERNNIVKLSLETGELQTVIAEGTYAGAFEYDPVEKEIYWSDMGTQQIKKSDLSGNSITVVANISATRNMNTEGPFRQARGISEFNRGTPVARVPGMALDADERMLFYSVNDNNEILVIHLNNGTKRSLINSTYQSENPGNIVLDKENKRIYWVAGRFGPRIFSAKYDGSNITTELIAQSEGQKLFSLTFDQENKVLYWADSSFAAVIYSKVLGEQQEQVMFEKYGDMRNIAFLDGNLYVSNLSTFNSNETLYYIPAVGGNKTFINIGEHSPTVFFIIPEDDYDPFRPEVYYELVDTGETTSELVFHCNFSQQTGASSYKTNWFVDDTLVITTSSGSWADGDVIMDQALTESQLKNADIATFGITVTCSVEATFEADNVTTSPVSYAKFIGILVTKSPASLAEGESGEVELKLTAPFGCGSQTPSDQCKLTIEVVPTQLSTDCNAATLMPSACGAVFESASWDTPVNITLYGKITSSYGSFSKSVLLMFRTVTFSFHATWGNYEISINIKVTKTSEYYRRKHCGSVNDPHLTTFDQRRYEHQYGGVFTLYKHKELPVEVQIKTARCGREGVFCNCGVAIRAGQSLYELDKCDDGPSSRICGDDIVVTDGRYNTEILLPTGGKVQVNGGWSKFINIQVYPSVRDVENSEGLCGFLSKDGSCRDDFYMRDGTYSPDDTSRDDCNARSRVWENVLVQFSESWRVPEDEDLFNLLDLSTLTAWPSSSVFCTCPEPTGTAGTPAQPICTADQAVETCKVLPGTKPAVKTECTALSSKRKRRSTSAVKHMPSHRDKRGVAEPTWPNGWTEASAQAFCTELFQNSSSIQACNTVPGVDNSTGIDTCLADIFLTGTTDFAQYAINEVTSKCLHEIVSDPELSETSGGGESVFDIVSVQVCAGDCSGKGTCNNGACVCGTNYGGNDCSIDLTVAPDIARVGESGLCDSHTESCDVISAFGETFVQEGAKCKFEQIRVKAEEQEEAGVSPVDATTQSVVHLRCERPAVTGDDSDFVMAYRVSVANPGDVYSEKLGLMVYDSRCIEPSVNGTTFSWTLKGQYCLHQGVCYEDKADHPSNKCSKCKAQASTWEIDGSCQSPFPVVAVVVGVVGGLVAIVLIAVVAYVCSKKRGKGSIEP